MAVIDRAAPTRLTRRARVLLVGYALVLLVVLFAPTSTVQASLVMHLVDFLRLFLPDSWVDFKHAEVVMNAVIIAPLSFLGSLVWRRMRWQEWTTYAFLGACAVEIVQGVLLPDRRASFSDIVANTAGACLGALLCWLLRNRGFLDSGAPIGS